MIDPATELEDIAEKEVLRVRGSYDAPGFQACLDAEIRRLKALSHQQQKDEAV